MSVLCQNDNLIEPTEIQVFYDAVNLYSSVPLDRSIQVIVEFLWEDHAELKKDQN